jgi:hypothetical protein
MPLLRNIICDILLPATQSLSLRNVSLKTLTLRMSSRSVGASNAINITAPSTRYNRINRANPNVRMLLRRARYNILDTQGWHWQWWQQWEQLSDPDELSSPCCTKCNPEAVDEDVCCLDEPTPPFCLLGFGVSLFGVLLSAFDPRGGVIKSVIFLFTMASIGRVVWCGTNALLCSAICECDYQHS